MIIAGYTDSWENSIDAENEAKEMQAVIDEWMVDFYAN